MKEKLIENILLLAGIFIAVIVVVFSFKAGMVYESYKQIDDYPTSITVQFMKYNSYDEFLGADIQTIPIIYADEQTMIDSSDEKKSNIFGIPIAPAGLYLPSSKVIMINEKMNSKRILTHETCHAILDYYELSYYKYNEDICSTVDRTFVIK